MSASRRAPPLPPLTAHAVHGVLPVVSSMSYVVCVVQPARFGPGNVRERLRAARLAAHDCGRVDIQRSNRYSTAARVPMLCPSSCTNSVRPFVRSPGPSLRYLPNLCVLLLPPLACSQPRAYAHAQVHVCELIATFDLTVHCR
jgi:hypothetical protein